MTTFKTDGGPWSTGTALRRARRGLTRLIEGHALPSVPIESLVRLCEAQQDEIADLRTRVEALEARGAGAPSPPGHWAGKEA